ncbi:AAA domain-containing protein [Algoriphagus boritolerans]|uniref:DNA helicase, putative n=2 Tax=Algoriphagus TaxID=246875 RepID=A0A1H5ZUK1_9BACT|nr:AAA domain-containing protein [Algoriphagus boritolerans]SEG40178.1 DNA helicase, putative [Algoriphagus boritolerans DSM 17298 = JCM 18970]
MSNIVDELQEGLKLLKLEWAEDLAQYKKKFLNTTLAEKKKAGITWHPIQLKKSKIGMGERLLVEIERFDSSYPSSFSSGKSVTFFSTHEGYQGSENRVNGVVNQVKKDAMVVTIQADELPEWMLDSRLGVDLLFDENTYREMELAVKKVIAGENPRLVELRDIALGDKKPKFNQLHPLAQEGLNFSQNEACQKITAAQDFAIVHGPPGTGKTTTLIAAIKQATEQGLRILVAAPSNAAVDLLVEKLVDAQVTTLRLGHPARVEEKILNQTLDAKITFHDSYRDLKKLRKEREANLKIAKQYKRNYGSEERAQRKLMFQEVSRIREAASHLEDYIRSDIFQRTQVFACTLVGAASSHLKGMIFDIVFIDEAAQGMEAATWIPILKAKKVVFAGDHCQLPPTIKSYEAAKAGLSVTLFEKIIHRQPQTAQMLQVQYRMPKDIMGFSNEWFYKGKLQAAENTEFHAFTEEEPVLEWIDTAGSGFSDQVNEESLSTFNPEEARFACTYLNDTLKRIGFAHFKQKNWSIGLIAPYSAQVRMLKHLIFDTFEFPNLRAFSDWMTIDTVDGFQGQERDLMLISLTRSNEKGEIGFLADERRMNVALTRAKRKLIVIGDSSTLANNPFFDSLLGYFEEKGAYRSVYEFL